ncbi:MAG: HAD family hydrolase [Candidatus Hodarchaeales archaeon]
MSKIVLFDLDGTLYDYDAAHRRGLTQAHMSWNEQGTLMEFHEFGKLYSDSRSWIKRFLADSAASHSRALYFQKFVEIKTGIPNTDLITTLLDGYYAGFYKSMAPYPGLKSALMSLQKKNYRLGIITNMQANIQYKKMSILGLGDMFEEIVTSEAVGHEKPHPLIFYHTLSLMGGKPENTFMIGDSLKHDIHPAAFIGITPIWFNPNEKQTVKVDTPSFLTIQSYSQLVELIQSN